MIGVNKEIALLKDFILIDESVLTDNWERFLAIDKENNRIIATDRRMLVQFTDLDMMEFNKDNRRRRAY